MILITPLLIVLLVGCTSSWGDEGSATGQRTCTKIDISRYVGKEETIYRHLEFSIDNRYLCLHYDFDRHYGSGKRAGRLVVFNLDGEVIPDATDADGQTLKGPFANLFPDVGWRTFWPSFVEKAECWSFDETNNYCFRCLSPSGDARDGRLWKGEFFQMRPDTNLLWQIDIPAMSLLPRPMIWFCNYANTRCAVVGCFGYGVWVVALNDGHVIKVVNYKRDETEDERIAFQAKFHLHDIAVGDPFLSFDPESMAFEPQRRLLAFGACYGKRIRILSLGAGDTVQKELHGDTPPKPRRSGWWKVEYLAFAAGKYLVAGYSSESKDYALRSTEIYEIDTWKKVWEARRTDIGVVCLSPDARLIATIKNYEVEVRPFL